MMDKKRGPSIIAKPPQRTPPPPQAHDVDATPGNHGSWEDNPAILLTRQFVNVPFAMPEFGMPPGLDTISPIICRFCGLRYDGDLPQHCAGCGAGL